MHPLLVLGRRVLGVGEHGLGGLGLGLGRAGSGRRWGLEVGL